MATDVVDFDFEIELEVLTAHHMDSRIPKSQIANFHKIFNQSDCSWWKKYQIKKQDLFWLVIRILLPMWNSEFTMKNVLEM